MEARIIQINRQITRIYVRFIISDEDTKECWYYLNKRTAEEIKQVKDILTNKRGWRKEKTNLLQNYKI